MSKQTRKQTKRNAPNLLIIVFGIVAFALFGVGVIAPAIRPGCERANSISTETTATQQLEQALEASGVAYLQANAIVSQTVEVCGSQRQSIGDPLVVLRFVFRATSDELENPFEQSRFITQALAAAPQTYLNPSFVDDVIVILQASDQAWEWIAPYPESQQALLTDAFSTELVELGQTRSYSLTSGE